MVSPEKVLKAYFAVMPKRIELLAKLKSDKSKIDSVIIKTGFLSDSELEQLMGLIGKDFLFRAENRNKFTLRHVTFKMKKSLKNFQALNKRPKQGKVVELPEYLKRKNNEQEFLIYDRMRNLSEFFSNFSSNVIPILEAYDNNLIQQYALLRRYNAKRPNLEAYKEYIEIENNLQKQASECFSQIKSRNITFINVIKEYIKFVTPKQVGGMSAQIARELFIMGVITIGLLTSLIILVSPYLLLESRNMVTQISSLVVGLLSLLATSGVIAIFYSRRIDPFIKIVKSFMI